MPSRTVHTGNPVPYDLGDTHHLAGTLVDGAATWAAGLPSRITVTADIEWSGAYNPTAHRTTTLDGLQLAPVLRAVAEHRGTGRRLQQSHHTATHWHAQLRALTATRRGYEAAARTPLAPTARTLVNWLAGATTPTAANRRHIDAAYGYLRTDHRNRLTRLHDASAAQVADALSVALQSRYGATIHLRNITHFTFHP